MHWSMQAGRYGMPWRDSARVQLRGAVGERRRVSVPLQCRGVCRDMQAWSSEVFWHNTPSVHAERYMAVGSAMLLCLHSSDRNLRTRQRNLLGQ